MKHRSFLPGKVVQRFQRSQLSSFPTTWRQNDRGQLIWLQDTSPQTASWAHRVSNRGAPWDVYRQALWSSPLEGTGTRESGSWGTSDYTQVQEHLSYSPVCPIWIFVWLVSKSYIFVGHLFPFEEPLGCSGKIRTQIAGPCVRRKIFCTLVFLSVY